jgi:quercetin dioxygenase-like cupin family protein
VISDCETAAAATVAETPDLRGKSPIRNLTRSPTIVGHGGFFNFIAMAGQLDVMHIFRSASVPLNPADPHTFVGPATVQRLAADDTAIPVGVYRVSFADGGRTNWHSHSGPQWLLVVDGRIRVQRQGEAAQDLGAGDAVVFGPGEKHWHGAMPGATGTHLAVNVDLETTWLEAVSESEYDAVEG